MGNVLKGGGGGGGGVLHNNGRWALIDQPLAMNEGDLTACMNDC